MRNYIALVLVPALILSACGGGGGGYGGSSSSGGSSSGGSSSGGQVIATPGKPNVDALVVDQGPPALLAANSPAANTAFVSVIVCIPGGAVGSASCQTIDHIQVDTQSSGLRIIASGATPMGELTLTLPVLKDATGNPMAECLQFASGSSWGSLATADMHMVDSTEAASGINVQIIGDPAYESFRPATCPGTAAANTIYDSVVTFGANGILGVGPFTLDCGSGCVNVAPGFPPLYYSCPLPSSCTPSASPVPTNVQVPNPVPLLAADSNGVSDTNGVIVELPTVGSAGTTTVSGALVFGIGTQTNNTPPSSVTIMTANATTGFVSASMSGTTYTDSFLDSGSTGILWGTNALTVCPANEAMNFYCPASTTNFTATLTGANNKSAPADFSVANAVTQFSNNPSYAAFPNLGGTNGDTASLDYGLSFFFGHNVYTGIEGTTAPGGGTGPYYGY